MRRNKRLIGQIRDAIRIAPGHKAVTGIREQQFFFRISEDAFRVGKGAFHLVEHHALIAKSVLISLIAPALLAEDLRTVVDRRMEYGIQIHIHQIQKILIVPAGYGINRLIRESHRVQEGLHRAFQKLHERLLHRVFVRAAQHRMLQNVEYTGGVLR